MELMDGMNKKDGKGSANDAKQKTNKGVAGLKDGQLEGKNRRKKRIGKT